MLLSLLLCALVVGSNGAAVTPHIIGGSEASYGDHPYGCSLQVKYGSTWYHNCGSAIWSTDWIVTAAHCVDGGGTFRVRCGEHHLVDNDGFEQTRAVQTVIMHENYGSGAGTIANDIAVLGLSSPLSYSSKVEAFRFANSSDGDFAGQSCSISGWGWIENSGSTDVLLKVDMVTLTNSQCSQDWPGEINAGHVCIKEAGKSSCSGDSGGPQRCGDVIVGLTSWGIGNCSPSYASVNTRVSHFHGWVQGKAGDQELPTS